jgi:cytochrome c oxidase subunit 4
VAIGQTAAEHAPGEHSHPGPGEYVRIAVILAIVTAIEVIAYYISALPHPALIAILLVMMVLKFSLVVLWFMHLRFDSRLFRRLFVTGIILAAVIYTVVLSTLLLAHHT